MIPGGPGLGLGRLLPAPEEREQKEEPGDLLLVLGLLLPGSEAATPRAASLRGEGKEGRTGRNKMADGAGRASDERLRDERNTGFNCPIAGREACGGKHTSMSGGNKRQVYARRNRQTPRSGSTGPRSWSHQREESTHRQAGTQSARKFLGGWSPSGHATARETATMPCKKRKTHSSPCRVAEGAETPPRDPDRATPRSSTKSYAPSPLPSPPLPSPPPFLP